MKMMGNYLVEMLSWLEEKKGHALCIVECGTIRNPSFVNHEDGLSTYHIAEWMANSRYEHEFFSFELDPTIIRNSREFLALAELDNKVTFGLGDAGLLLSHFNRPIDFCYLDAGADPIQNLFQFRQAQRWMDAPGFVVIDDVFDERNADRGLVTVPYAKLEGHTCCSIAGRMAGIAFGEEASMFLKSWEAVCV